MSGGYPIVLDVSTRAIVVVGGGNVAVRKVQGLLAAGAKHVKVVAPQFHEQMPAGVQQVAGEYRPEHLHGASLVFAATDSRDVNDAVVRDAHKLGALVCRADADDDSAGDFTTPAILRHGQLLVAVSSGSPALSAMIRDRLEQMVEARWAAMADALQTLRPIILQKIPASRRRQVLHELCSEAAMSRLSGGGIEGLRKWLAEKFAELKG